MVCLHTKRRYNGFQIIKVSVSHTFSVPSGTAWQNYKMDFTVTYEQLNYYIIRHHRSFVMLDLITCLWGRRGLLSQVTLDSTLALETETEEGSSYESVRENIQGCGPCFKWHSTRLKNAECLLIFHDIFQNKQMPNSGDHLRWRGCFEEISKRMFVCAKFSRLIAGETPPGVIAGALFNSLVLMSTLYLLFSNLYSMFRSLPQTYMTQ